MKTTKPDLTHALLHDAMENSPHGILYFSDKGVLLCANDAGRKRMKRGPDLDPVGQSIDTLWNSSEATTLRNLLDQVVTAGRSHTIELPEVDVTGQRKLWRYTMSRATHDDNPIGVRAVCENITQLHEATSQLEEERERSRVQNGYNQQFLNTMQDGYILADTKGNILNVNPAYEHMVGYTKDELRAMHIGQLECLLSPEEIGLKIEEMTRLGSVRFASKHRAKSGQKIDIDVRITVLQTGDGPRIAAFVRDMSESLQMLRALKESELRASALFEEAPHAMMVASGDGTVRQVNRAAEVLSGTPRDQLIGRFNMHEQAKVAGPEMQSFIAKAFEGRRAYLGPHKVDYPRHGLRGQAQYEISRSFPLFNPEGQLSHVVFQSEDVTEAERSRRALEWLAGAAVSDESEFFQELTQALTGALAVRFAFVAELHPDGKSANVLAVWDGSAPGQPFAYPLAGTPCQECVVRQEPAVFPSEVQALFPEDALLVQMGVQAYAGIPLHEEQGKSIGLLVVMDDRPFHEGTVDQVLFNSFATRAESELLRFRAKRELERANELFQGLMHATKDAIFIKGRDRRYLDMNAACAAIFRKPADELRGLSDEQIFPPDLAAAIRKDDDELFKHGKPIRREEGVPDADGATVWFETIKVPWINKAGDVIGLIGVARNITDARRARAAQNRLWSMLDSSLNEVYVFRADNLRFEYVNKGAMRNLGYETSELAGLTPLDLKPGFNVASFRALLGPLETGEMKRLKFRSVHRRKDGSTYPVDVQLQLIKDEDTHSFLAVIYDLTDQVAAEDRITAESTRFETLALSAPVGIFETDGAGNCTYVNPRWCQLVGMPAEDALGEGWVAGLHPDDRETVGRTWQRITADRSEFHAEYRFVRPDGSDVWVEGRAAPILGPDGSPAGYIGTIADITERVAYDRRIQALNRDLEARVTERTAALEVAMLRAQEADQTKSNFLAIMSHELRTPLNSVIGFSGILMQELPGPLNPEQQKQLRMINESGRHLLNLINDILDISKIEAGRLELMQETFP